MHRCTCQAERSTVCLCLRTVAAATTATTRCPNKSTVTAAPSSSHRVAHRRVPWRCRRDHRSRPTASSQLSRPCPYQPPPAAACRTRETAPPVSRTTTSQKQSTHNVWQPTSQPWQLLTTTTPREKSNSV